METCAIIAPPKSRATLIKRIVSLVKSGRPAEAVAICRYGKNLSENELALLAYYAALRGLEDAMNNPFESDDFLKMLAGPKGVRAAKAKEDLKSQEKRISMLFLKAVNNHDKDGIIDLANAVWLLRDWEKFRRSSGDKERAALIRLKQFGGIAGEPLTIAEIAFYVGLFSGKKVSATEDGYSALRRKCKQLGITVIPSRKTSSKKSNRSLKEK